MKNTLYNRINEVADQQAVEGKPWRSFVGQHDLDSKGERVYEKQAYKMRESIVLDIGNYSDHDVHPLLEEYDTTKVRRLERKEIGTGINRGSNEVFEWYVSIEEANEILCEVVSKLTSKNTSGYNKIYKPRPHQTWVVAKILDRWFTKKSRNLIQPVDLCPRYGKDLKKTDLFKQTGFDVMISAGFWLASNESTNDTIKDGYDISSDITIIGPTMAEYNIAKSKKSRIVIDLSLHMDIELIEDDFVNELAKTSKLVYIDEADYGAWTEKSRAVLDKLTSKGENLIVIASGSNIDRAVIGRCDIENPIVVSYLDLLETKHGRGFLFDCVSEGDKESEFLEDFRSNPQTWIDRLSDLVEVACYNMVASDDLIKFQNKLSKTERFNVRKMVDKRNSNVSREMLSELFYDPKTNQDIFGMYETMYKSIEKPAVLMFINTTIETLDHLCKIGKRLAPHYNWIALHGENYTNRSAQKEINKIIMNGGERTVILSCGMGSRSFSVGNIIATVIANDGGSPATTRQQGSRCLTPGCGKENGLVVYYSLNKSRFSTFESDLISSMFKNNHSSVESSIRRVHGIVNFLNKDEYGYLVKIEETDFVEKFANDMSYENIAEAVTDYTTILSIDNLSNLLSYVKANKVGSPAWDSAIKKAKTYIEKQNRQNSSIDPNDKSTQDLMKKIQTIIKSAGNVYWLSPTSTTFKDALSKICSDNEKMISYRQLVGVSASVVLDQLLDHFPERMMDLIFLSKGEKNTGSATHGHTSGLFDELLDSID